MVLLGISFENMEKILIGPKKFISYNSLGIAIIGLDNSLRFHNHNRRTFPT